MCFFHSDTWRVQFLEADLKTPLPRTLAFRDASKVREMFDRFGDRKMLENRQALEHAVNNRNGGLWPDLTNEQYAQLKRGR